MGHWNGAQLGLKVKTEDKALAEQFLKLICPHSEEASFYEEVGAVSSEYSPEVHEDFDQNEEDILGIINVLTDHAEEYIRKYDEFGYGYDEEDDEEAEESEPIPLLEGLCRLTGRLFPSSRMYIAHEYGNSVCDANYRYEAVYDLANNVKSETHYYVCYGDGVDEDTVDNEAEISNVDITRQSLDKIIDEAQSKGFAELTKRLNEIINNPESFTFETKSKASKKTKLSCSPSMFDYKTLDNGTIMITGYESHKAVIGIPEMIDGCSVTCIGEGAFECCDVLVSITIPDSITEIEGDPFGGCENLTELIVSPDHPTLVTVEGVLFSKKDKRLICYPAGLKEEEYAIPNWIQSIGEVAFEHCVNLTSIVIPDGVKSIEDGALYGCSSLTSVMVPASVTSIGYDAFEGCDNIIITVSHNSYAEQYCIDNNIEYRYSDG